MAGTTLEALRKEEARLRVAIEEAQGQLLDPENGTTAAKRLAQLTDDYRQTLNSIAREEKAAQPKPTQAKPAAEEKPRTRMVNGVLMEERPVPPDPDHPYDKRTEWVPVTPPKPTTPARPTGVSAPANQPYIVTRNPDGTTAQTPNPNYRPPAAKGVDPVAEARAKYYELLAQVQQGKIDDERAKREWDQFKETQRLATDAGENAVNDYVTARKGFLGAGPEFARQYAEGLKTLSSGGGPVNFTADALMSPIPDLEAIRTEAVRRALDQSRYALPPAAGTAPVVPSSQPAGMPASPEIDAMAAAAAHRIVADAHGGVHPFDPAPAPVPPMAAPTLPAPQPANPLPAYAGRLRVAA